MRGLYASIQTPSPLSTNGGGQAAFQYLQTLTRLHEVDVIAIAPPNGDEWLAPLRDLANETIAVPWSPSPVKQAARFAMIAARMLKPRPFINRPFIEAVRRRMRKRQYDFVQVDWTEPAQWIEPPKGPLFLCCAHDVRWRVAGARGDAAARVARLEREETGLFKRLDRALFLSDSDVRWVKERRPDVRAARIVYRQAAPDNVPPPWNAREPGTMLYVGHLARKANERAVESLLRETLPAIRGRVADAQLWIAGDGASNALRELAESAGARLMGFLPSLDEVYRKATLLLSPVTQHGGTFTRIIEAMSWGTPVLTNCQGNDPIGAPAGKAIAVADSPGEMAEEAVRLLEDGAAAEAMGRAGREYALREYGPGRAEELIRAALAD